MTTVKFIHWQEDDAWLGYLQDYPDYRTQGETPDDLLDHLKDLYHDLSQSPGSDAAQPSEPVHDDEAGDE